MEAIIILFIVASVIITLFVIKKSAAESTKMRSGNFSATKDGFESDFGQFFINQGLLIHEENRYALEDIINIQCLTKEEVVPYTRGDRKKTYIISLVTNSNEDIPVFVAEQQEVSDDNVIKAMFADEVSAKTHSVKVLKQLIDIFAERGRGELQVITNKDVKEGQ